MTPSFNMINYAVVTNDEIDSIVNSMKVCVITTDIHIVYNNVYLTHIIPLIARAISF